MLRKGNPLHCWWEYKLYSHYGEQYGRSFYSLKTQLPDDPAIPLLGVYPEKIVI